MHRTVGKLGIACLLTWLLALPQLAAAAPPALLPLQGYLTDDADVALDGSYKLAFTLYDDALTGSSQYTSTEAVSVAHGNFTVYLGDQAPLDLKLMQSHDSLWLEIKIVQNCAADTTCNTGTLVNRTLSPRLQLATTAFAASAAYCGDASTVGGQAPAAFATANHTHAYSSLTGIPAGFADGVDNDTTYTAGAGLALNGGNQFSLMSGCSSGQVLKSNGAGGWACAADNDTLYVQGSGISITSNIVSASFGGTGSATTVARSDHTHDAGDIVSGTISSARVDAYTKVQADAAFLQAPNTGQVAADGMPHTIISSGAFGIYEVTAAVACCGKAAVLHAIVVSAYGHPTLSHPSITKTISYYNGAGSSLDVGVTLNSLSAWDIWIQTTVDFTSATKINYAVRRIL